MTNLNLGQNWRNRSAVLEPDGAALATFLRNKHPHDTVFHVSQAIGASPDTVENWLNGVCVPQLRHFGRLIGFYGPPIIKAVFPAAPGWLDDAVRQARIEELESEQAARMEELRKLRGGE